MRFKCLNFPASLAALAATKPEIRYCTREIVPIVLSETVEDAAGKMQSEYRDETACGTEQLCDRLSRTRE